MVTDLQSPSFNILSYRVQNLSLINHDIVSNVILKPDRIAFQGNSITKRSFYFFDDTNTFVLKQRRLAFCDVRINKGAVHFTSS